MPVLIVFTILVGMVGSAYWLDREKWGAAWYVLLGLLYVVASIAIAIGIIFLVIGLVAGWF